MIAIFGDPIDISDHVSFTRTFADRLAHVNWVNRATHLACLARDELSAWRDYIVAADPIFISG